MFKPKYVNRILNYYAYKVYIYTYVLSVTEYTNTKGPVGCFSNLHTGRSWPQGPKKGPDVALWLRPAYLPGKKEGVTCSETSNLLDFVSNSQASILLRYVEIRWVTATKVIHFRRLIAN